MPGSRLTALPTRNWLTRENAEYLAGSIRVYWGKRGRHIETLVYEDGGIWVVRSNLSFAVPQGA